MTDVAGAVFVGGASGAPSYPVHILVALGGVLGKVDARPEHTPDIGVPLIKAFVDDGVDEGGAWVESREKFDFLFFFNHTLPVIIS